jgi:hypothetical protein
MTSTTFLQSILRNVVEEVVANPSNFDMQIDTEEKESNLAARAEQR